MALLGLLLLGACGLPPNTAVGDWSRTASIGTDRPSLAAPPHAEAIRAMQQGLGTYFFALGILWDNAALPFRETEFAPLAAQAARFDPAAGEALQTLTVNLRTASADTPSPWLPRDNSGPRPQREDWRLVNLIATSDGAVQLLLASLARAVSVEAAPAAAAAGPVASTAALQQLQQEALRENAASRAARAAARQDYAIMLGEIGAGHAALKAPGIMITQREVERRVFLADDRLRRAIAILPREAPQDTPEAMAAVLPR